MFEVKVACRAFAAACSLIACHVSQAEEVHRDELVNCLEPFNVRDCTGPAAGKSLCYFCRYGARPVVCVFAREIDGETAKLIARIDALVGDRRDRRWAAFVVLLAEDTRPNEQHLKKLAAQHKLRHTPLTIYRDTDQKLQNNLRVPPDAHILIRWWRQGKAVGEREFGGRLDAASARRIITLVEKVQ